MVNVIVNSKSLNTFLKSVLKNFDDGDLFEFENGKLSCVFDSLDIEHKGSGFFAYSKSQLNSVNSYLDSVTERPILLEFMEGKIKIVI